MTHSKLDISNKSMHVKQRRLPWNYEVPSRLIGMEFVVNGMLPTFNRTWRARGLCVDRLLMRLAELEQMCVKLRAVLEYNDKLINKTKLDTSNANRTVI